MSLALRLIRIVWPLVKVLVVIACIVLELVAFAGCSWLKSEASDAKSAFVDCTKAESVRAVHELGPVVDVVLAQAVAPDTKVSWQPLKDLAKGTTAELFGCVLADVVARNMKPPSEAGAPKAGQLAIDHDSLVAGFRELAIAQWGGATFKTPNGAL